MANFGVVEILGSLACLAMFVVVPTVAIYLVQKKRHKR